MGNGKISKPISLEGGMRIQVFIHTELPSGEKVITATLINDNKIDENNGPKDKARLCAFQTEIKLTGIDNEVIFLIQIERHIFQLIRNYKILHFYIQM